MTENEALEDIIEYGVNLGDGGYVNPKSLVISADALKEIQKYREIGTVEECRKAREKQIPKKPIFDNLYACPTCHTIMLQGAFEARGRCCKNCGQLLDWSES